MALGETRQIFQTNSECTVSGVAERGGLLSFTPGVAGLCEYSDGTAISGGLSNPLGVLLGDVEDLNHFRVPEYRNRNVVNKGSVEATATKAELITDFVETVVPGTGGGASVGTYLVGDTLFLADDGKFSRWDGTSGTIALLNSGGSTRPTVGRSLSTLGSDGFLKVKVDL